MEKLQRLLREQVDCHKQLLLESQNRCNNNNNLTVVSKELTKSTQVMTKSAAKDFARHIDTLRDRFEILESRVDTLVQVGDTGPPQNLWLLV